MIRDFNDFKCTFCGNTNTKKIDSEFYDMRKCKCGSVTDRTARKEDEFHRAYHEAGKEPKKAKSVSW